MQSIRQVIGKRWTVLGREAWAVALLLVAAMAASPAIAKDTPLGGLQQVDSLTVARGDRILATEHLRIVSKGPVVIAGSIEGRPGVSITIEAPVITVTGSILGGPGLGGVRPLARGGDGGSIVLDAPTVVLDGAVVAAGNGGTGGAGGDGGDGGGVTVHADDLDSKGSTPRITPGQGGEGGAGIDGDVPRARNGGGGGSGGDLRMGPSSKSKAKAKAKAKADPPPPAEKPAQPAPPAKVGSGSPAGGAPSES